jgi:hypothetical protein
MAERMRVTSLIVRKLKRQRVWYSPDSWSGFWTRLWSCALYPTNPTGHFLVTETIGDCIHSWAKARIISAIYFAKHAELFTPNKKKGVRERFNWFQGAESLSVEI